MSGSNEQQLGVAIARLEALSGDMVDVKATLQKVADAVTKLAVVEERQTSDRAAIGRAFKELEKHDERIKVLEQAQPMQKQASTWVFKAVGQVISLVVAAVAGAVISAQVVRGPEPRAPLIKHEAQRTTE